MLSGYSKAINRELNRRGKLFSHNTEAKILVDRNHLITCFHYIHQNPVKAGLCSDMEEWEYSSYRDYANLREGTLVNKKLALERINFDAENFVEHSKGVLEERFLKGIW